MKKIKKTAAWLVAVLVFSVAVFCMLYNFPQKAMVEFENGEVKMIAHAQYLIETVTADELRFALDNGFDASIQFWRVLPSMVKKMHEAGLKVGCWTVDKLWQASLMKTYGVDYITSNILV